MDKSYKNWRLRRAKSNDILKNLLLLRGIKGRQVASFLHPDYQRHLSDALKIKDMKRAVERALRSGAKGEKVAIFTDYDADGIPAGVLLAQALEKAKIKTQVFIPTRKQGYGLSREGVKEVKSSGASLLITVDMGITSRFEIDFAHKLGIESIVIDHHLVQPKLFPKSAYAVINPKQRGDNYPFKELCACGLVFKFVSVLSQYCKQISDTQLKWWLDLVGISTIADMVPLLGENRVLAHYGLIVLAKTKRPGLISLYKQAGIQPEDIDATCVSFQIAPRINAPGRLVEATSAFDLLSSKSIRQANLLAKQLERANKKRQNLLEEMTKQARSLIIKKKLNRKRVILLSHKHWHPGLVGLVAGKIAREFQRPAFILSREDKQARGSARSPLDSFHIVRALQTARDNLVSFGGHAKAGGLSYELNQEKTIYQKLLHYAKKITAKNFQAELVVDMELAPEQVNLATYRIISQLKPYGIGNPEPLFLIRDLVVNKSRAVGKKSAHLQAWLSGLKAIGFGLGARASQVNPGAKIDIIASLEQDSWNGKKNIQLKIIDFKVSSN